MIDDFRNLEKVDRCLQHRFAPHSICFGCGPANQHGLQLKSFLAGAGQINRPSGGSVPTPIAPTDSFIGSTDRLVACFLPAPHHQAFAGSVHGGILGALIDCQMNWTACWNLMQKNELNELPSCVTATFQVDFLAPTSSAGFLLLVSEIEEMTERKAVVRCELGPLNRSGDGFNQVTAKGSGIFVAVKQDHPAFHRWTS